MHMCMHLINIFVRADDGSRTSDTEVGRKGWSTWHLAVLHAVHRLVAWSRRVFSCSSAGEPQDVSFTMRHVILFSLIRPNHS